MEGKEVSGTEGEAWALPPCSHQRSPQVVTRPQARGSAVFQTGFLAHRKVADTVGVQQVGARGKSTWETTEGLERCPLTSPDVDRGEKTGG